MDGEREVDGGKVGDEGVVGAEEWVMVFLSVQSLNYRTGLQIVKKS